MDNNKLEHIILCGLLVIISSFAIKFNISPIFFSFVWCFGLFFMIYKILKK